MRLIDKRIIIFLLMLSIFLFSGCSYEVIDLPETNKIDLNKLWEINMDSQMRDYVIDKDKIYVITQNQWIYIIDINKESLIKKFKLNIDDELFNGRITVYDDVLSIVNYNKIIVVDTNSEKILYDFQATNMKVVALRTNMYMYEELLIFSHLLDGKIYGMNYSTGKIEWEIGGDYSEHGNLKLYQYKDKYLYTKGLEKAYYQYDPLTGRTITKYEYEYTTDHGIKNEKRTFYKPVFKHVDNIELKTWLIDTNLAFFHITSKGYIYTEYEDIFYLYDRDEKLRWKLKFPKEILFTREYKGKYVILYLTQKYFSDSLLIFDIEEKEIVWNIDTEPKEAFRFFMNEDKLFISDEEGSFKIYDLSKLKDES